MPTNKHMKKKRLIFGIIALQFILFPTFAQDKLLGILKTELHQQMQELQKKEFPPYHELPGNRQTFLLCSSLLWGIDDPIGTTPTPPGHPGTNRQSLF